MAILIDHFKPKFNQLSYSEKAVLYYLDKNFGAIDKNISLSSLAESCNVSTTTVIRMCQKLNLEGFSNLKYQLLLLQKNAKSTVVDDVIIRNIEITNALLKSIDFTIVDKFIYEILNKKRVFIISLGLSRTCGKYFSNLLIQSQVIATYVDDVHYIKVLSQNLTKDDLIIFVSASGETPALIELANTCIFNKVSFLTITNVTDSTLYQKSKIAISTNTDFRKNLEYDVTYRSYMMLVIEILYEGIYKMKDNELDNRNLK